MKLVRVVQEVYALPSRWDAWTDTGDMLVLKYRRGTARVWRSVGNFWEMVVDVEYGHPLEGLITLEQFCEVTGLELAEDVHRIDLPDPNDDDDHNIDSWYREYDA